MTDSDAIEPAPRPDRRRAIARLGGLGMLAAATALGLSAAARAEGPPPRLLVGFPAGGTIDAVARLLAAAWRSRFASPPLVEQRVGAGGRIAVVALKEAAPDGLTLLLSPASIFTIYPHVYRRLPYDPATDVLPVSPVCDYVCGLGVGPLVPEAVRTLADFVAWVRANPRLGAYGSPAAGAMPHFLGTQFARAAGIELTHVPYRGAVPGLQELMGGQIAAGLFALGDFLPQLAGGRLRLLAVADGHRSRHVPAVPTFAEQGYPALRGVESFGLFLPARAPAGAATQLFELTRTAMADPAVIEGLARLGLQPAAREPAAYARQLAAERERWAPVVRASGFMADD
jgi:tripartite-type tricarboxylate transporter receptor subunit TctC